MSEFLQVITQSLPETTIVKLRCGGDCYGISRLISRNLCLPGAPFSTSQWLHGWIHEDLRFVEQLGMPHGPFHLVATEHQELFFKSLGFNAKAIGVPYVYAVDSDMSLISRRPKSLLVMPPHSMSYSNEDWDEGKYLAQIISISGDFDEIVGCIGSSCVKRGKWVGTFEKLGIPWVCGPDMADKNSLIRMHRIFSHFEYMTTNSIGSHVAYAAFSGCKVSIYGDYYYQDRDAIGPDELYIGRPELLDHVLFQGAEETVSNKFPFFFCHPMLAVERTAWAAEQLGANHKKSSIKMSYFLGWLPHQQIYYWSAKLFSKVKNKWFIK
ncbi:MAG: hypothetical protein ACI9CE_003181 [Flavobacterium sp.]|jgi:hypothetical protein